jgi:DNA-binding HxlR family transcriptional regulator
VVGDRWTLLIVRELSLRGDSRYTDLRNGLPGIASNLLADRLRELEAAGVVAREEAAPPIATTVFRLTPRGADLQPVLDDLMHWGLPMMTERKPDDAVRSHWLAGAIEMMFADGEPGGPPVTLQLVTGDQPIAVEARDGAVAARIEAVADPDVTLTGPPTPILGLLLGRLGLADAKAKGVSLEGDRKVLERFAATVALGPAA